MIDRTTFDLRLAEHTVTTASINRSGWQRQGGHKHRAIRAALASALVALAVRLTPDSLGIDVPGQASQEQPVTA